MDSEFGEIPPENQPAIITVRLSSTKSYSGLVVMLHAYGAMQGTCEDNYLGCYKGAKVLSWTYPEPVLVGLPANESLSSVEGARAIVLLRLHAYRSRFKIL